MSGETERERALLARIEALEHENASLQRYAAGVGRMAYLAGKAAAAKEQRDRARQAHCAPRALGGGLSLVKGRDYESDPSPQDDFNQAPAQGEEAA
jgi:hypothetical protein